MFPTDIFLEIFSFTGLADSFKNMLISRESLEAVIILFKPKRKDEKWIYHDNDIRLVKGPGSSKVLNTDIGPMILWIPDINYKRYHSGYPQNHPMNKDPGLKKEFVFNEYCPVLFCPGYKEPIKVIDYSLGKYRRIAAVTKDRFYSIHVDVKINPTCYTGSFTMNTFREGGIMMVEICNPWHTCKEVHFRRVDIYQCMFRSFPAETMYNTMPLVIVTGNKIFDISLNVICKIS